MRIQRDILERTPRKSEATREARERRDSGAFGVGARSGFAGRAGGGFQAPSKDDAPRDPSVQIFACPSVRREVETVAAEIWSLVQAHEDLTFDQIAVLVNGPDRDLYLPHIASVFEEAHAIPFNVADASLASESPLASAALSLLALPSTRFTRPDVLAVITHPSIRPIDVDVREWIALADRL